MHWNIDLNAEPASVALADIDNFRAFQIEANGPKDRLEAALEPYGRWDGEFAWFRPDAVVEAAGERAGEDDWKAGFAGLQAYAADNGYLHEDGSIRAHVEWS